jgi:hypothetical protein
VRILISRGDVSVHHGLNDQGRLVANFHTNDHIVVEVDGAVDRNDIEFRAGPFVVEPRILGTVRERVELIPSKAAHAGRAGCTCNWHTGNMRHHAMNCFAAMEGCCK